MKVYVWFYENFRDIAGRDSICLKVGRKHATVKDVLRKLDGVCGKRFGKPEKLLKKCMLILHRGKNHLNDELIKDLSFKVKDGDILIIKGPPVIGGG
ncbi:MAG: hypothetical protein N3E48_01520 [Candidatus Bathyarchaeota archaeon]|nr:hypothetical protein [Candidatus Bathyarchaeota archaeon]